jgi:hypothetical protein
MPPGHIEGPSAWDGSDMAKPEEWLYRLPADEIAEIGRRGGILVPGATLSVPLEPV